MLKHLGSIQGSSRVCKSAYGVNNGRCAEKGRVSRNLDRWLGHAKSVRVGM